MSDQAPEVPDSNGSQPHLHRQFGLLQSTALNMANMVGVGPFITIPLLMTAMGGPQAMFGWFIAALTCIPDGLVWSELGAAYPKSGGPYVYLQEGFGPKKFGRLMAFLFLWQFLLSGPLEIASGYIGFSRYFEYLWQYCFDRALAHWPAVGVAMLLGVANIVLLYRRIGTISRLTVALWVGMIVTVVSVIVIGAPHFDRKIAFDFPPDAFNFNIGFLVGLGSATRYGLYDYLGYYNVCHMGDEVRAPGRTIPRAIMISVVSVAAIYMVMNLILIGVVPWREFVPNGDHPDSDFVFATLMARLMGRPFAAFFTLLILWTTCASVFTLLLGYSRIPYAAALDGAFFGIFGKLHPRKEFPHISLLLIGVLAIIACALSLDTVISTLLAVRILVQFVGQIAAVVLLRKAKPDMPRPYRIWLYPIPCIVAVIGWIFAFVTLEPRLLGFTFAAMAIGVVAYFAWARATRRWPFDATQPNM